MHPRLEPPAPPPDMPLWQIALLAVVAVAVSVSVLHVAGVTLLLLPVALLMRRSTLRARQRMGPPIIVPPDLDQTARPQTFADGTAACTGCDAVVPFESMSIGEDGYFCPGCARQT